VAIVRDFDRVCRVRLMPSLHDDAVLLAACECSAADEPGCPHVWAAIRAIEACGAWPRDVATPSSLTMTDLDDPDLELIADQGGTAISGGQIMSTPELAPRRPTAA
jgi:hypothetical protein